MVKKFDAEEMKRRVMKENSEGELYLNRQASTVNLRKAQSHNNRPGWESTRDWNDPDFVADLELLEKRFRNVRVIVHDPKRRHLSLVDRSDEAMSAATLEWLSKNGYRVVRSGIIHVVYVDGHFYPHASVEVIRHEEPLFTKIREHYNNIQIWE